MRLILNNILFIQQARKVIWKVIKFCLPSLEGKWVHSQAVAHLSQEMVSRNMENTVEEKMGKENRFYFWPLFLKKNEIQHPLFWYQQDGGEEE